MKTPKQGIEITKPSASAKNLNPKVIDKLKPASNLNFSIDKDVNFDESEIRITFKGNNIVTKFLLKGLPVKEQVVLVKPIPTPPPIKPEDVIKALKALKFNFKIVK
jgi:hypothetical protein